MTLLKELHLFFLLLNYKNYTCKALLEPLHCPPLQITLQDGFWLGENFSLLVN